MRGSRFQVISDYAGLNCAQVPLKELSKTLQRLYQLPHSVIPYLGLLLISLGYLGTCLIYVATEERSPGSCDSFSWGVEFLGSITAIGALGGETTMAQMLSIYLPAAWRTRLECNFRLELGVEVKV